MGVSSLGHSWLLHPEAPGEGREGSRESGIGQETDQLPTAPPSLVPVPGGGGAGELGEVRGDEGPLGASALEPSPSLEM